MSRRPGTVDDGLAALRRLPQHTVVKQRAFEKGQTLRVWKTLCAERRNVPQQGMNLMALLQKLFQYIMSEQPIAAQEQYFHGVSPRCNLG